MAPRKPSRKGKTKFLDASEIDRGIAEIAELAQDQGARVALLGGAALQLFGSDRLTKDVDLVSSAELEGVTVKERLSFGGLQVITDSGVPVDLIMRDDDYADLYEEALQAAERMAGVPVPVVLPEYILAMKLQAGRAKDVADMEFLVLDSELDYPKARAVVKKHLGAYAADELDRYRDSVTWERGRLKKGKR